MANYLKKKKIQRKSVNHRMWIYDTHTDNWYGTKTSLLKKLNMDLEEFYNLLGSRFEKRKRILNG